MTTPAITIFEGLTCATLSNGQSVVVEDTANADGSISATKVTIAGLTGVVSGPPNGTSCPTLTFTVASTEVTTSAATLYEGITCDTIANGQTLEVLGAVQLNGSITASTVALN